MVNKTLPRGIRNNNPLNIRISNNKWLGKVVNNTDGAFEQFTSLEYGIRAGMRNIKTILTRLRQQGKPANLRALISIWAPSSDGNNVNAYVHRVETQSGVSEFTELNIKNKDQICAVVDAMIQVECGQNVSFSKIDSAYKLAFGDGAAAAGMQK